MNKIAKFEKVSYLQFKKDYIDCFNEESDDKIKEIYDNIKLPKRATKGSAGHDFYSPISFELKPNEIISYIANGLTYVVALSQTNEIFQIVELVFAILTSVILLLYRLWKWYNEAKKDGKITREEIQDGIDIIIDGVEDIKKKGNKKDDNSRKD